MKAFRCQICGETYLGETRPDRCPYCGSVGNHLVSPAEWIEYGSIPLTPQSKELSLEAIGLEMSNTAFYRMCVLKAETKINAAVFERLAEQEEEHAELICEMAGVPIPIEKVADAPDQDSEKYSQAHARELRAVYLYQQILRVVPEIRVQQVFAALTDVEGEHLKISNLYR